MARVVAFNRQPFARIVRYCTVAEVLPIGAQPRRGSRSLLLALWRRADEHENALLLVLQPDLLKCTRVVSRDNPL